MTAIGSSFWGGLGGETKSSAVCQKPGATRKNDGATTAAYYKPPTGVLQGPIHSSVYYRGRNNYQYHFGPAEVP